jgi:hypothetical protein
MSLSRRQFVYAASLSVVAASASPSLFAQGGAQAAGETITDEGGETLATFSLADFEGLIGARFSISLARRSLGTVALIAATAAVSPQGAKQIQGRAVEGFSLRFRGAGATLPQDTYLMEESSLGAFPLFLVPDGPVGSNRPTYLAIFTRFAGSASNTPAAPSE